MHELNTPLPAQHAGQYGVVLEAGALEKRVQRPQVLKNQRDITVPSDEVLEARAEHGITEPIYAETFVVSLTESLA